MSKKHMINIKIAFYKHRAKLAYTAHEDIVESLSCGRDLANHIAAARLAPLKRKFNNAINRLSDLGDSVPKFRL